MTRKSRDRNAGATTPLATAVLIAHVAANTTSIRLGAGGVMLPNHAPLIVAEQFGNHGESGPGLASRQFRKCLSG